MRADRWFKRDKGDVHEAVLQHVAALERSQSHIFERFYRLDCLYDPYRSQSGSHYDLPSSGADVSENLIASNVDTVTAIAAATEVRPRFVTDNAGWNEQRRAKRLGYYSEGIAKRFNVHQEATLAFKGAALKGTGLVKVWVDWDRFGDKRELRIEETLVDDIIVDEQECRYGRPRQLHQRVFVDRDELADAFPDHEERILNAQTRSAGGLDWDWHMWAGYRPFESHQIVVIESWFLPRGKRPGRHTISIDGATLLDEEWDRPFFPFARMVWSERRPGWYGIGGAERIAGHQRRLNKFNWQLDRMLDQHAMPTTYVHISDASLQVKTRNSLGNIAPYKTEKPQTVFPQAMSPDMLLRRGDLKESGYEEFGVSRLAASAKKPAGLESGAALREYRDATTQRFALQEKAFERLVLDIVWLAIDACKELGKDSPDVYSVSRRKKLKWSEVNMDDVRLQLQAASNLPTTPAGRRQLVIELSQAGIVSQEEARRLLGPIDPLDVESALSLYTAALDHADWQIEEVLDGAVLHPEPYMNLELSIWRFQQAYLKARVNGAPEETAERLRQWITQAAWMINPPAIPQNDNAMVGPAAPMADPMAQDPALAGALPAGPPQATPAAALAPEAMNLIAG
jgi:hypothetical protein